MKHEPEEYELALRAREGDREALAALVERTRLRLFALAYAELRHYDDAHDAVASALLQICRHITELREPERVRAWMQSIVRNEVRRLRRGPDAATLRLEETDATADDTSSSLLRLDIERALCRLPGDQARVSRMFYLADLSIAEIARRTGRPEGTIKSWLHRGRQRLAHEMEDYAPMTPTPSTPAPEPTPAPGLKAALIHTDLEPALAQRITEALRTGGYDTRVLRPGDPTELLEALKEYDTLVLDDRIGGRSAFEFLMHIRSHPEMKEVPVGVLASDPPDFTASAYFTAGVNRLVNKNNPDDVARLAQPIERPKPNLWGRFTDRARRVVYLAQEEAAQLGENYVGTEHLLLGLTRVPDSAGATILVRLGISLESVENKTRQQVTRGTGNLGQDMQLTPRAKKVIDLAYDEACLLKNNYIGVEHLLLGLVGEGDGLAATVLVKLGADLERVRREVWAMQAGP
jgi:RNA polymerase sigma factor (sigma-70 family)